MAITLDTIQSDLHSIAIKDSGGDELAINASGQITAVIEPGAGAIVVSATDLDIRDLDASQDNVAISDGTDTLGVNADGSINVNTTPGGFSTWQVTTHTADTTVGGTEIASTPLSGRLRILIQNLGAQDVYLREATGVTTSNGLELPKGSSFEADIEDGADLWVITGSGTSDLRVVEYAA